MNTMQRRHAPLALLALLAAACSADKPAFKNVDITGATYAQALSLPDADGKLRTLAEIAEARQRLGADGAKVQPVFVTVDPERDTAAVLKAYVAGFGPDVVALRGSVEQTQAAAKDFKIFFAKVPGKEAGSYTIDHTAGAFVFDPQGRVRLFVRYGAGVDALTGDLKLLLGGA
jgi:protein SCO1/2